MNTQDTPRSPNKAIRLAILLDLKRAGYLDGLSLQEIANRFPGNLHRCTIMRDLRSLEYVEQHIDAVRAQFRKSTQLT